MGRHIALACMLRDGAKWSWRIWRYRGYPRWVEMKHTSAGSFVGSPDSKQKSLVQAEYEFCLMERAVRKARVVKLLHHHKVSGKEINLDWPSNAFHTQLT